MEVKTKTSFKMITTISVSNYKSICQEQKLEIRPLTILAGANSSGKSSIMQPLLLMKQTLEAPFDPGPLLLDGPNVKFTSTEQIFCKSQSSCSDFFTIKLEINEENNVEFKFNKSKVPGVAIGIGGMSSISNGKKALIHSNMSSSEIEEVLPEEVKKLVSWKNRVSWEVIRERCFLSFTVSSRSVQPGIVFGGLSPATPFGPHIKGIIHVPGLRGNPARTYGTTAIGKDFPGTFENYCASIINHWQSSKDRRLKDLGKALEVLGLTWKVEARPVDDTRVELRVGRLPHSKRGGARDLVSIADVGFGVSQTLPVIVALLTARPGQIVYLEQPEIHLHPKAQKLMAKILADAAKRGVLVIVETHSNLLLRGVQTLVAAKILPESDVKLHWFTREEKSGATLVQSSGMDAQGAFGEWPEDFDEVLLEAESEYLDAVESQGALHE